MFEMRERYGWLLIDSEKGTNFSSLNGFDTPGRKRSGLGLKTLCLDSA